MNTYNYKPFGDVLSKTGSAPDPKYLWCGTWGYRASGNKWVSHYVRARHYSFADAAWTSIDPLWPSEMAYGYVEGRVMTGVDYWGMKPKRLIGPYRFNPDKDCGCGSQKGVRAKGVPNPGYGYHIVPTAGVPLNYEPDLSQNCFDRACSMYCASKHSLNDYYRSLERMCQSGDLRALSSARAINSVIPPCTKGNPFWEGCSKDLSAAGMWQVRPHQSAYPEPSYYFTQNYCAVECIVRICCAESEARIELSRTYRPLFDHCYFGYTYPRGGYQE